VKTEGVVIGVGKQWYGKLPGMEKQPVMVLACGETASDGFSLWRNRPGCSEPLKDYPENVTRCSGIGPPFVPRDVLNLWKEKNHQRLELSEVHRETTEGVRVTVMPFYMGWRLAGGGDSRVHWWR
jgi:hypothetical protein